ncbi:MAG: glycosyltransferase family 4 protein [Crocinitomicaceae bacterium]
MGEKQRNTRRLLLVGPSTGAVHLENYYNLIQDYFDQILIITTHPIDYCDFEIVDFSFKSPLKIISQIRRMRAIMNDFNPGLIHVHQVGTGGYLAAQANKKKYPLVVTAWGSDVLLLPKQGVLKKHVVKRVLMDATIITVDANFMADTIRNLGIKNEIQVANFGIVLKDIENPEKQNIIYSNRLHKDLYNIDLILKGFSKFVKLHPDWKLIVAAKGSNTEKLKQIAQNLLSKDQYEFIGFVDQDTNLKMYQKAKIWVSVPDSDGTAISLLEAMGYGCIPVTSDLPANREWINDNENGIIVKNDLSEALEKALQLDHDQLAKYNESLVKNKATKKVNREIFVEIYNKILERC